jgi:hypothetical protein
MALTVQNLRAVGVGVEPASLLPGQIAFNITDKVLFVGDGSSFKTNFDGTQVAGVPGEGWYAMPMDFASLGDYYVPNPGYWGDVPTDQQVLTWSTALNHPIWTSGGGGGGGNQVYVITNADVAAASGSTTSDKITAAIGVASPDEGDVTIVTGLPDDVYEGLYFFTTEWVKGAAYAYPSASEVIYDNTVTGLTPTVQGAIDDLDAGLAATTAIANTANSTANSALSIANAALPKAGGTMTGTIISRAINVQPGYDIQLQGSDGILFNSGANGTILGISDLVTVTSSTTAASSTAVRTAYNLAQAAVPRSTYTAAGDLVVGTGTSAFTALPIGPADYILASTGTGINWVAQSEGDVTSVTGVAPITVDNTDAQNPIVGIDPATTAALGAVQVGTNIDVDLNGVISVKTSSTTQPGVVQLVDNTSTNDSTKALTAAMGASLQTQLNGITISGTVTLAGSIDANTGLVSTVTTQGASAVPPFVPGAILPAPAAGNDNYYVIVTNPGTFTPPGGSPVTSENGDWILSDGVTWQELEVGARPAYASTTTAGVVVLSTDPATQAGIDPLVAVTPVSLQSKISDSTSTTSSTTIASSTAVKAAYDLANDALPKTGGTMTGDITFQDSGEGVVFNGGSSLYAISDSVATTSSTTAASSTAVKAAYDIGAAAIPCATITAVGDIVVGGAGAAPTALPVGTNGQVLVANSACATGLEWVTDVPGDVTSVSGTAPITVDNTDPQNPIVGIDAASTTSCGAVQLNDTVSSSSTTEAATANAVKTTYDVANAAVPCSSFTALGELLAGTGTGTYSALTVGTDGQVLLANSLCAEGLEWGNACYVPDACFTAAGEIIVGTGVGTYVALPVGTDGQTLLADSSCAEGVKWGAALEGFTQGSTTFNTALGVGTGCCLTTGTLNVLLGAGAGDCLTTGSCNIAIGYNALGGSLAGSINETIAIGFEAGGCLYGGSQNIIVGTCAGFKITSGFCNVVIGDCTACGLTGGAQNTIIGAGAASSAIAFTSNANTGVGFRTFHKITSGASNSTLGSDSGCAITTGSCNVTLGSASGYTLTTGCLNTFLGYLSGCGITTGGCNTIVGRYSTATSGLSNNVILSDGAGTVRFQANANGAWSPDGTNFGTAGQVLASQGSGAVPVWCTLSLACVPCSAYTGQGVLLAGTGVSTFSALPVGSSGQFLTIDLTCSTGLKWVTSEGANLRGYTCTTTPFNTALGANAGDSVTSGTDNVVIGYNAGTAITTGGQNIAIGRGALQLATTATGNVAIGHQALIGASASQTTAVGFNALSTLTSGVRNTAVGYYAGGTVTTGTDNTFIGYGAGDGNTGSASTIVGAHAGNALTLGGANIFIGANAGDSVTTGFNNTIVGDVSGSSSLVGNLILAAGTTIKFQANSNGAWSPDGTNYGTSGQILTSAGTGAAPAWSSSLPQVTAPTASTDAGTQGQIASDATYFYMYTGGRWQRVAWDATAW